VSSSRRPAKKPSRARDSAPRARAAKPAAKAVKRTTPKPAVVRAAAPKKRTAEQDLPNPAPLPTRPVIPPPRPGIRLAGSASSRLTIKPSPQTGPRPQLEFSTKVRPGGQRKLSEVELDEDEVLIDGFDAVLDGEKVRITAVLERTCVYVHKGGERRLARKEHLWVEADKLPIRRRGLT
jgi:hypothetical protein